MARRQQVLVTDKQFLKKLKIVNLRGIKNLDEISFEGCPVTGIFGLNGSGKTTILQTILCLYRAKNPNENTKMSRFFKYTTAANKWIGSSYSAVMDYEQFLGNRRQLWTDKEIYYGKVASEWYPRQKRKPDRNVIYIQLSDSIPDIEKVSDKTVTFSPAEGAILDEKITIAASQIMGVNYRHLKVSKIKKLDSFTVERNGTLCHSLNLGAGEQKVFRILQRLFRAPQYSLIVIDEIDLTLHTAALRQLIHIMIGEAKNGDRNLQIVFTSHRQELMKNAEFNVRFIINTALKTFCMDNPTEGCYEQLSGEPQKYLKVYVEDEVAEAIVRKCMQECGMSSHYQSCCFGSITNSLRLALGLACQYENLSLMDDIVFFGDGDVPEYTETRKIKKLIEKILTGGDQHLIDKRDKVLHLIKHFCPQQIDGRKQRPEEFIHEALGTLSPENTDYPELVRDSNNIMGVLDPHEYVKILLDRGHLLGEIISTASKSNLWNDYVHDVKEWINERKAIHELGING